VRVSEDDVFDNSVGVDQFTVLMDHSDPHVDGIQRGFKFNPDCQRLKSLPHRLILPEEDFHQGALASTILAKDGMNLTDTNLEVYIVVGNHTWESLGYALASKTVSPRLRSLMSTFVTYLLQGLVMRLPS